LSMLSAPSPSGTPWLPQAPRPILHVEEEETIGAPFYMMERVRGVILRRKLPPGMKLDAKTNAKLADAFVDQLVALHGLPWETIGLGAIAKPDGYVERQVTGWTRRWHAARTDDVPDVEAVATWLAANQPPPAAPTLI